MDRRCLATQSATYLQGRFERFKLLYVIDQNEHLES